MGDPACWMAFLCPECGAFLGDEHEGSCSRCGADDLAPVERSDPDRLAVPPPEPPPPGIRC